MVVIPVILDIPVIPVKLVKKVIPVILEPTHSSTQYLSDPTQSPYSSVTLVIFIILVIHDKGHKCDVHVYIGVNHVIIA